MTESVTEVEQTRALSDAPEPTGPTTESTAPEADAVNPAKGLMVVALMAAARAVAVVVASVALVTAVWIGAPPILTVTVPPMAPAMVMAHTGLVSNVAAAPSLVSVASSVPLMAASAVVGLVPE